MDETPKDMSKFCGDPIWPANSEGRYTVQFQLSCGYVIVNPEGIESTLGYANKHQADIVAEAMTEGRAFGKAEARASLTERDEKIKTLEEALEKIDIAGREEPYYDVAERGNHGDTFDEGVKCGAKNAGDIARKALTKPS